MVTWYLANRWGHSISAVQVKRETRHFVVLGDGQKRSKVAIWDGVFATAEEARAFLSETVRKEIENHERSIQQLRAELEKIERIEVQ